MFGVILLLLVGVEAVNLQLTSCSPNCPPPMMCSESVRTQLSLISATGIWYCNTGRCLTNTKTETLRRLKEYTKEMKGQDDAFHRIHSHFAVKFAHPDRPLTLHFAGDNGVGKTWLARLTSRALFQKEHPSIDNVGDGFVQLDIPTSHELGDEESIARARRSVRIQLAEALKSCERSVVLIDELETIHPKIISAIAPAFKGDPIHGVATNRAIFILTSDFGSEGIAAGKSPDKVIEMVWKFCGQIYADTPEIQKTVTIVPFASLLRQDFYALTKHYMDYLPCKVKKLKCVKYSTDVTNFLVDQAWEGGLRNKNARAVDEQFTFWVHGEVEMLVDDTAGEQSVLINLSSDGSGLEISKYEHVKTTEPHSEL
eukprot:TRINITY_DN67399_c1_g1_i1.p1 TRINITY_DN67399_c1_g1~~TRINITY_DN67399_c1_g1_i1.p1  ORF type:complete len:380 (+),score=23.83 TRINITY_DN67399_c1_g1_i1:31-1140(+)